MCDDSSDCQNGLDDFCNFVGDGTVTYCYGEEANVVAPQIANQVMCTNGGTDIVLHVYNVPYKANLGSGDDIVATGSNINTNDIIEAGPGSDIVYGGAGADIIYGKTATSFTGDGDNRLIGDDGNDYIYGADGDDIIYGKNGDDYLVGQGGRDVLKGGEGADQLYSTYGITPANDVLGSILCGDGGPDLLMGSGPGHQCLNAGLGQTAPGPDCFYVNNPPDSDDHDIGTARNCYSVVGPAIVGKTGCGCELEDNNN